MDDRFGLSVLNNQRDLLTSTSVRLLVINTTQSCLESCGPPASCVTLSNTENIYLHVYNLCMEIHENIYSYNCNVYFSIHQFNASHFEYMMQVIPV